MTEIAHSIDLNLSQKLRDKAYRRKFFWAESCAQIAKQLIELRKRRGLNQKQVAEMTGTKQPAISRAEQADYQNRNLNTLLSIADVLDARVRVLIEPSEDILREYDNEAAADAAETDAAEEQVERMFAATEAPPSYPIQAETEILKEAQEIGEVAISRSSAPSVIGARGTRREASFQFAASSPGKMVVRTNPYNIEFSQRRLEAENVG